MPITGKNPIVGLCLPASYCVKLSTIFSRKTTKLCTDKINLSIADAMGIKAMNYCTELNSNISLVVDGVVFNQQKIFEEIMMKTKIISTCGFGAADFLLNTLLLKLGENKSIVESIKYLLNNLPGGYSCLIQHEDIIYATRDYYGIKPLHLGYLKVEGEVFQCDFDEMETDSDIQQGNVTNLICSDFDILEKLGAKFIRHVLPGEVVMIAKGQCKSLGICHRPKGDARTLCSMQYVALSNTSGYLDDQSIQDTRYRLGKKLAESVPDVEADFATCLPSVPFAFLFGYAAVSKHNLMDLFYYQGSSINLEIYPENLENKKVVLVIDSIFNCDLPRALALLAKCSVATIHLRVCSPEQTTPCPFGITFDQSTTAFLANTTTVAYLNIPNFKMVLSSKIPQREVNNIGHCLHCFGVKHPMIEF